MLTRSKLGVAGAAMALVACSAERPIDADPSVSVTVDQAIVHGARDGTRHRSVVALIARDGAVGHLCTAAVIAPDVVLTARHCVAELLAAGIECPARAPQVGASLHPGALAVHPSADARTGPPAAFGRAIHAPRTDALCDADLALVTLDRPVAVPPMRLARGKRPRVGDRIVAVGYGQLGDRGGQGLRRFRSDVSILSVSPAEMVVDESTCSGDSGGPAIDEDTGEILGVLSRGSSTCAGAGARNVYTRVTPFLELIDRVVGVEPPPSPAPPPANDVGEPCSDGGTCAAGLCLGAPSGYCTRPCGGTAKRCPNGYRCTRPAPAAPAVASGSVAGVCAVRS
ncbi:MAG: S1 family peptidase [Deltaproteobacteria bacterium]|nr:S1 family peptidase [Deltaproteobacteria bacterium]